MGGLRKTVFFVSGLELTSSSSEKKKIINPATKPTSPPSIEKKYTEQSRWDEGKIHADKKNFSQTLSGFEPPISCLQASRINHYATEPHISH